MAGVSHHPSLFNSSLLTDLCMAGVHWARLAVFTPSALPRVSGFSLELVSW